MLLFVGIVLAISGGIHLFLYRGLVRGLSITSPAVLWPLRVLAAVLAVSYVLARWLDGFAPPGVVLGAHWIASVWVGLMFHLFWIGLAFFFAKVLLVLTGGWARLAPWHPAIGRGAVLSVAATAVVLCVIGMISAQSPARVRHAKIPVKALSPELAGLKIALAADFHAGILAGERQVARWVDEINALHPDLVLLPGDIVDHPPRRIAWIADAFARLRAPLGVFATTGNHEYYIGVEPAVALLRRSGMRVLMNERVELPGGLIVAGIEDRTARSMGQTLPTYAQILGPEARSRPTIFLNHTPATEETKAAIAAGADLVVSGHTHGGQIWPFGYLSGLAFPFLKGVYEVGAGRQLTTSGIGYWGPPMRLGNPPEIWLIELVPISPPSDS